METDELAPDGARDAGEQPALVRNEVLVVGRLPSPAVEVTLPSGDVLVTFRVVVDRPPVRPATEPRGRRRVSVDTLDCAAWSARARRAATRARPGDVVEVRGALRRRFWRTGGGAASRTEIEVQSFRRLARAEVSPRRAAASAGR